MSSSKPLSAVSVNGTGSGMSSCSVTSLRDSRASSACSISRSPALLLLDVRRGLQHALEVAVLLEQSRRCLGPDAGHPGDVVATVAGEREQVPELFREHAELRLHLGGTDDLLLHRVVQDHRRLVLLEGHELHEVLVGRHDDDAHPRRHRLLDVRGDDVVRLPLGMLDPGQAQGVDRLVDEGKLRGQIVGRGRAVGLVLRVLRLAAAVAPRVEDRDEVLGMEVAAGRRDHAHEAVHRVDRTTVGRGEHRQRVIGPIDEVVAVEQEDGVLPARRFSRRGNHQNLCGAPVSDSRLKTVDCRRAARKAVCTMLATGTASRAPVRP